MSTELIEIIFGIIGGAFIFFLFIKFNSGYESDHYSTPNDFKDLKVGQSYYTRTCFLGLKQGVTPIIHTIKSINEDKKIITIETSYEGSKTNIKQLNFDEFIDLLKNG